MSRCRPLALVVWCVLCVPCAAAEHGPHERHFQIRYTATVGGVPIDAKSLRVWMPYPESDAAQTVGDVFVEAPFRYSLGQDPEYGNRILYLGTEKPPRDLRVTMTFDVTRREYRNRPGEPRLRRVRREENAALDRFRKPNRLVPLNGKIAEAAHDAVDGQTSEAAKARAIYDYVTTQLTSDRSGTGWGRGDAIWACEAKRGDCADYHALLIAMARSVGIPAKFEIGLALPPDQSEGTIAGYDCWAAFYLDGIGWVPVDALEGSESPDRREYFFGAWDENRVRLSVGRDIMLDPRQGGPPLNYFVYPYAEVDGQPFDGVTQTFSFRDLPTMAARQ